MVFTGLSIGIILSVSRGEQEENWGQLNEDAVVESKNLESKAA
jgi:hypothetical protein